MEKAGFRKEGEGLKAQYHDGIMKDRLEYAINKDDFELGVTNENVVENFNNGFWLALDKLVAESKITIDRPKGSRHPKYPDFIYPLDYGYLENTSSSDGGGIDIWKGTNGNGIDAIICTVDLLKRDSEIKILIGCTEEEKLLVAKCHNSNHHMSGILIRRGK
jgi:inorganic pyrophosphatase